MVFAKYGNSEEYDSAVFLLDSVIAHLVESYGSRFAVTILYFPAVYASQPAQTAIEAVLKDHVLVPGGTMLYSPHFYLGEKGKNNARDLCLSLHRSLSEFDVSVTCDPYTSSLFKKRAVLQTPPEPSPNPNPNPDSAPTTNPVPGSVPVPGSEPAPETPPQPAPPPPPGPASTAEVQLVHMVLWTVVFLILSLFYSCYMLAAVDGSNEPEFKANAFEMLGGRAQTQKVT